MALTGHRSKLKVDAYLYIIDTFEREDVEHEAGNLYEVLAVLRVIQPVPRGRLPCVSQFTVGVFELRACFASVRTVCTLHVLIDVDLALTFFRRVCVS